MTSPDPLQNSIALSSPLGKYMLANRLLTLIFSLPFLVLGVLGGLVIAWTGWTQGDAPLSTRIITGLFAPLILSGSSILGIIKVIKYQDLRVESFSDGLVVKINGQTKPVLWKDIAVIYESIHKINEKGVLFPDPNKLRMRVQLRDGQTFSFNKAGKTDQLANLIRKKTDDIFTEETAKALDANQTIKFGEIALSPAGIEYCSKSLSWDKLSHNVNGGKFNVWDKTKVFGGTLIKLPADKVPNLYTLVYAILAMKTLLAPEEGIKEPAEKKPTAAAR